MQEQTLTKGPSFLRYPYPTRGIVENVTLFFFISLRCPLHGMDGQKLYFYVMKFINNVTHHCKNKIPTLKEGVQVNPFSFSTCCLFLHATYTEWYTGSGPTSQSNQGANIWFYCESAAFYISTGIIVQMLFEWFTSISSTLQSKKRLGKRQNTYFMCTKFAGLVMDVINCPLVLAQAILLGSFPHNVGYSMCFIVVLHG